jgi:hypothetical protein
MLPDARRRAGHRRNPRLSLREASGRSFVCTAPWSEKPLQRSGGSSRRRNIFLECLTLALDFLEAMLHHVTDRDEADEAAMLDNRKMPEPSA